MNNICSECGFRLAENYNYCPNCGSEILQMDYASELKNNTNIDTELIICENCGEANQLGSVFCNSCGISLNKTKVKIVKSTTQKSSNDRNKRIKPKVGKQKPKSNNQNQVTLEKKIDTKKIFAIIASIVGVITIILLLSGVINLSGDKSRVSITQQNINSGIDLRYIDRINELKELIEREPNNISNILELANLQFDSGFFEEASRNYSKYLQSDPQNADARIDMAVCFYNMQQFEKAEAAILEAIKYSPKHQTGFLNLGIVYLAQQKVDAAKEWFKKTIELNPNTEVANKARSLLQTH